MNKSKMLSKDLENLELKYASKVKSAKKFVERNTSESAIKVYENCFNALEQIRRIRIIFERHF